MLLRRRRPRPAGSAPTRRSTPPPGVPRPTRRPNHRHRGPRRSDELNDEAMREASARRAEADALYEAQQADAAQAAADFETTLAERRDKAEREFAAQFETAKSQLVDAQAHLDRTRDDAQRIRAEAETGARRLVEDAQKESGSLVAQARTHADRIREESDRELAAATQRRDSINAQLTNVRQMLATLTSVAPAGLLAEPPAPDAEPSEDVGAAAEDGVQDGTGELDEADGPVVDVEEADDATGRSGDGR